MNDNQTKDLQEALKQIIVAWRKGHATPADVQKARRALARATQNDPDTFKKRLEAGREWLK